ncbi:MAG: hypothetical protein K0S19_220, partial [Geminicoccaceae bacterium]|nr:hypothetical protein [Geminicoccaceae bacterium]
MGKTLLDTLDPAAPVPRYPAEDAGGLSASLDRASPLL